MYQTFSQICYLCFSLFISPEKSNQSKLFSTSASGLVLQVEEHRYRIQIESSTAIQEKGTSIPNPQTVSICVAAGIKRKRCGGCFQLGGATWVSYMHHEKTAWREIMEPNRESVMWFLDGSCSLNGPCYTISEMCHLGKASYSKITLFHFVQVGHTRSFI